MKAIPAGLTQLVLFKTPSGNSVFLSGFTFGWDLYFRSEIQQQTYSQNISNEQKDYSERYISLLICSFITNVN